MTRQIHVEHASCNGVGFLRHWYWSSHAYYINFWLCLTRFLHQLLYEALTIGDTSDHMTAPSNEHRLRESSTEDISLLESQLKSINDIYPTSSSNTSDALSQENHGIYYISISINIYLLWDFLQTSFSPTHQSIAKFVLDVKCDNFDIKMASVCICM